VDNSVECPANEHIVFPYYAFDGTLINVTCQACCINKESSNIWEFWKFRIPPLQNSTWYRFACDLREEVVRSGEERGDIEDEGAWNIDPADFCSVFAFDLLDKRGGKPEVQEKDYLGWIQSPNAASTLNDFGQTTHVNQPPDKILYKKLRSQSIYLSILESSVVLHHNMQTRE